MFSPIPKNMFFLIESGFRWVHGDASTSSIVWKKECCQLYHNKSRQFRKHSRAIKRETTLVNSNIICICILISGLKIRLQRGYVDSQIILPSFSSQVHYRGASRQASPREPRHGNIHHNEPWLRWAVQPARQLEEAVPKLGHDHAGQAAHC